MAAEIIGKTMRKKLTPEQNEARKAYKIQLYIDGLSPEKLERYYKKKNRPPRTDLEERKRLRASQQAEELRKERESKVKPKQYGDDHYSKKQSIENQIEQLLIERESNPLDFTIQSKINQLNCRL